MAGGSLARRRVHVAHHRSRCAAASLLVVVAVVLCCASDAAIGRLWLGPPNQPWRSSQLTSRAAEDKQWTFGPKSYSSEGEFVSDKAPAVEVVPGLWYWLRHMRLEANWDKANSWCADSGAATMLEVLDNLDDLREALSLEATEDQMLRRRARLAYSAVNGFSQ
eukprot:CAMPEP_0177537710 /NCGR_PEP_ID=MMETSP0369-20130122/57930_1 /TAXON_ID=447022 ORGANISM="Scrippsiella hangoei-like, Strain SHHI-4" /NCGR_SAMPLE_ID=MMETSP0369 /ASSEMBLY_ACC=CAM_ASM_000364 /LENGTH=163 /DNA_ID=CAMNT_0019020355 /DNA_START=41 /DNA_END=532 /DNA_ORIENTATION=-